MPNRLLRKRGISEYSHIISIAFTIFFKQDIMINYHRKNYILFIYMVFTIEGLFEVAIESWPEWALNPTITEFRSDALTDWAIGRWAQLALRANLVQLLQFHRLLHLVIPFLSLACYQTINIPFCQKLREMWTDFHCIIHGPVIPKQCMIALNVGLHCSIKFAKIEQARNITWIQLLWDKNKWLNKCSFKDSVFKNDN